MRFQAIQELANRFLNHALSAILAFVFRLWHSSWSMPGMRVGQCFFIQPDFSSASGLRLGFEYVLISIERALDIQPVVRPLQSLVLLA